MELNTTKKCPLCGNEYDFNHFRHAHVWWNNKKRCLFVCCRCARENEVKRKWASPRKKDPAHADG